MKEALRKLAVLAASAMMVASMSAASFAADFNNGVYTGNSNTINVKKTLKVENPNLSKVAGPGIQFAYSIAPATVASGTTITDNDNHTATVHPGPTGGIAVTTSPEFTKAELLNASAAGASNEKNIVLTTDASKFTAPGVYRYKFEDTTTAAALDAAGITRSENFDSVRYIDVYIVRNANDELEIGGYVIGSDENGDGNLTKEDFDTSTDEPEDPSGGGSGSGGQGTVNQTADVFTTYNIELEKEVTGNMGDRNHEFPFAVTLSNTGRNLYASKTAPSGDTLNLTENTTNTSLKHGEKFYIAGLTKNDTVAYTMTNNTQDAYSVAITGGTPSGATQVAAGGTKAMDATNITSAASVKFTSNLDSVSPTGVIMRFGAPLMVLIAGIALVMLNRKSKKADTVK